MRETRAGIRFHVSVSAHSIPPVPEQYLQVLLDLAPDAMIVASATGKIRSTNAQTFEMFGYLHDELVGKSVEMLMPERFRAVHRAHRSSYFSSPKIRPMGRLLDLKARRKDGTEFPVDISISPLCGETGMQVVLAIRDMSTQRRMESELRRSEEHFRVALASLPMAIFNQDRHLHYTWIYSSIPSWLGPEWIGHKDAEIFGRHEAARLTAIKKKVLESAVRIQDETKVTILGQEHILELRVEPMRGPRQGIAGLTGAYFDVSEMKHNAMERERLISELQAALEQVKLLRGLISICASCKRIFNEEGSWQQLESYLQAHSEAKFTHGICPECMKKLYPDFYQR
jgi:PAS domain S-box-containing protein